MYTETTSKVGQWTGLKATAMTTAGFVNDSVLINTGSFTIVDFRRFEPVHWPTFEVVSGYACFPEMVQIESDCERL